MSGNDTEDGDEALLKLDRDFARLMARFDQITGHRREPGEDDPLEADIDPQLERDLQLALMHYLAQREGADAPDLDALGDEARLQLTLDKHIKPLFDVIFATAQAHARAANEAIRAGRDPSARRGPGDMTIDVSSLLEDDS
jgi:hypothetical protein